MEEYVRQSHILQLERHGVTLPDSLKACELLENAEITSQERKIVLGVTDLKFENMSTTLLRTFSGIFGCNDLVNDPVVKNEEEYVGSFNRNKRVFRGDDVKCYKCNRVGHIVMYCQTEAQGLKTVPRCFKCGCLNHLAPYCPIRRKKRQ